MNLCILAPKQAHVAHAVYGLDLVHRSWKHALLRLGADLGSVMQDSHHLV